MKLQEFLYRVLPDSGIFYVATTDTNSKFRQHKVTSTTELADNIAKYTKQHKNTYFATGSFNEGSREACNSKLRKTLHLDLDCGPDKEFLSKPRALQEFVEFCKAIQMPAPSILVDSGNGLHVYWTFEEAIPTKQWMPLAEALQAACDENSFPVDSTVTSDAARILRAPESVNYKDITHPKPCKVIKSTDRNYKYEELLRTLRPWFQSLGVVATPSALPKVDADDLAGGISYNFSPKAKYIVQECEVLKHQLNTGGADVESEILWQQSLYLLAFCEDGYDYAHAISDQYKGYAFKETEHKWLQQVTKAAKGRWGATLCTTFAKHMQDKCLSCPHNGGIKSPISLGKPPANELPFGYWQNENGLYHTNDEETEMIAPFTVHDFSVNYDLEGDGLVLRFRADLSGATHHVELPSQVMADSKSTYRHLTQNCLQLHMAQVRGFTSLMASWTQQMQQAKIVQATSSILGWFERDKKVGFITAGNVYWNDGTVEASIISSRQLASQYTAVGSVKTWSAIANYVIDQDRMPINVGIASAFASPLVKFTGVSGLTLAMISQASGTGKSTALKIAQAVWGHPIKGVNALSDTQASVIKKLGILNNLPAYWDELRIREDVDGFIRLMFQLGQGKEKSRLTQSINFQDMGTWNLLMTVASNESLIDHIDQLVKSTDAGRRRVFEIAVDSPVDETLLADNMARFSSLEQNYGAVGVEYAKWLAVNSNDTKNLVAKYMQYFTKSLNASSNERFWIAYMAATVAGAQIAAKLGYANFNIKGMIVYLTREFERMRGDTDGSSVAPAKQAINYIVDFVNTFTESTVIVKSVPRRGQTSYEVLELPERLPVLIEIGRDDDKLRIDKTRFTEWVYKKGGQPTAVVTELLRLLPSASVTRASLGKGVTNNTAPRIYILEVDTKDKEINRYFN